MAYLRGKQKQWFIVEEGCRPIAVLGLAAVESQLARKPVRVASELYRVRETVGPDQDDNFRQRDIWIMTAKAAAANGFDLR